MWFTKAAEQGIAEPQHNLGFANAQANLGVLYVIGQDVPTDNVQAYKWWSLASRQGSQIATDNRNRLRTMISPDQIAEAERLIHEFKPKRNEHAKEKNISERLTI